MKSTILMLIIMALLPFKAFAGDGLIIDRSISLLERTYENGKDEFEKSSEFKKKMDEAKSRLIEKVNFMAEHWDLSVTLTKYDADLEIYYFDLSDNEETRESHNINLSELSPLAFGVPRDEAKTLKDKTLKAKIQFRLIHKFNGCYTLIDDDKETCDHDIVLIQHGGVVRDVESGKEYYFK